MEYPKHIIDIANILTKFNNLDEESILSELVRLSQTDENTVKIWIEKAREYNSKKNILINTPKEEMSVIEATDAVSVNILTKKECLEILSNIAKGIARKIEGEYMIPTEIDRIKAIQQIEKNAAMVEWVKITEYAKSLKISHQAVKEAINKGRIPASAVRIEKAVKGGGRYNQNIFINKQKADIAWVGSENAYRMNKSQEAKDTILKLRKELEDSGMLLPKYEEDKESDFIDFNEAQRREKVAKAHIASLELLKLQGTLVQKDLVYKQLFEAGSQLRTSIMAVPDRITSEVISAGNNKSLVRKIIADALNEALQGLTDIIK